jgi:trbC/VIRB2 family
MKKAIMAWKSQAKYVGMGALTAVMSLPFVVSAAHAQMKKAPKEVCDGMDTLTGWATWIGGGAAVLGLIVLGISLFFHHRHGGGASIMEKIGYWVAGVVIIGSAGSIAGVFIARGQIC